MEDCRDGGAITIPRRKKSLKSNAFQKDYFVQRNKEVRSLSSAYYRFGCLLLFSSLLKILAVTAIRVFRTARTFQFSK